MANINETIIETTEQVVEEAKTFVEKADVDKLAAQVTKLHKTIKPGEEAAVAVVATTGVVVGAKELVKKGKAKKAEKKAAKEAPVEIDNDEIDVEVEETEN